MVGTLIAFCWVFNDCFDERRILRACTVLVKRGYWLSVRLSEEEGYQLEQLIFHFTREHYFQKLQNITRSELFREFLNCLCPDGEVKVFSYDDMVSFHAELSSITRRR